MDVEVIIKRTLVYAAALALIAAIYGILLKLAGPVFYRGTINSGTRSSRFSRRWSSCCSRVRSRTRFRPVSIAFITAIDTTTAARWSASRVT